MVANDPSGRPSLTKLVATTGGTAVEQLVDSSSLIDSLPKGVTNVCNGNKPLQQNATVHSPIAIVGVACRLPGHCTTPHKLWDFITAGSIANANSVPESRFSIDGHYDGSLKPHTMRSPGGMCLEDIDLHAMDAQFFNASRTEAIAMDPQQRQLLEVVYECLENGGITLESISGKDIGCFVGSYAVDFADMQARDPLDRAESITIGIGRAILSNRISHFLNIKGPSMTIDTACSGSLVSVDVACQYLQSGQVTSCVVAGANLYLSPDHNQDMGAMRGASSATGRCHTFDAKADGYIKAEAVNAVFLKRLDDALKDGDPIRAIIRGTATNSDGWTPGIASPSSEAQAKAIRAAYANAGITNFNETGYLECHGTGTLAGDPVEVKGVATVFSPSRDPQNPLIIGSIKSNVGHSEPAAGLSGLLKAVLAVESGIIPGNPTFVDPNPSIDFTGSQVRATRWTVDWPKISNNYRRASVNSFGFGGSNAHVVVDNAEHFLRERDMPSTAWHVSSFLGISQHDLLEDEEFESSNGILQKARPHVLVFSANDEQSLKSSIKKLSAHLLNPSVNIKLIDLAHTLSERRTRHYHRAFIITSVSSERITSIPSETAIFGRRSPDAPKIGFIFTGQGAQWSQMGHDLLRMFPETASQVITELDIALQTLPDCVRPGWLLAEELSEMRSPEYLRQPEFSQPLVTALQLAMVAVLESWGISPRSVVGHSSGEIAAACVAGYLTREQAIRLAYFRGLAAKQAPATDAVGMLAVGLGPDEVQPYLSLYQLPETKATVEISCFNSPSSLTLSGSVDTLVRVREAIQADGHFARMLQVNLAYHSRYMHHIGEIYEQLLVNYSNSKVASSPHEVEMFSSVTGVKFHSDDQTDIAYWKANMVSPVRFAKACHAMLVDESQGADFLVEIGPSNALAGPVSQICKALSSGGANVIYTSAAKRGPDTIQSLYNVAGRLFLVGGNVSLAMANRNELEVQTPAVIIDLPNYAWNHSTKYWQESEASKDWRYRKFAHHDLLGSKVLGMPWDAPVWKNDLHLENLPWLRDHMMGPDIIFPGAGYIAMAIEAVYQATFATASEEDMIRLSQGQYHYHLRDLTFARALVLDDTTTAKTMLILEPLRGSKKGWFHYKVSSFAGELWNEHSTGLISLESGSYSGDKMVNTEALKLPLVYPISGRLWYKAMQDAGYNFGKSFQNHLEVESTPGQRFSRSLVSLDPPPSKWSPQSDYPLHPACLDGCFQSVSPSLWEGDRSGINAVLVPAGVDSIIIAAKPTASEGLSITSSEYLGVGRREDMKNYISHGTVYDATNKSVIFKMHGLRYHRLETRADVYTAHIYTRLSWMPDISQVKDESKLHLALKSTDGESAVQEVIDLAAHKNPNLAVIEFNMDPTATSSLWLSSSSNLNPIRAAYSAYHFCSNDPGVLLSIQEDYKTSANTQFSLLDPSKTEFIAPSGKFDLAIVKIPSLASFKLWKILRTNLDKTLSNNSSVLLFDTHSYQSNGTALDWGNLHERDDALCSSGFASIRQISHCGYLANLASADLDNQDRSGEIIHVRLNNIASQTTSNIVHALRKLGWRILEVDAQVTSIDPKSTILILDELEYPLLANATESHWSTLKTLIQKECNILWVTQGALMSVTSPSKAVAHGFFRTVRAEEPLLSLITLDVESVAADLLPNTIEAIDNVLHITKMTPMPQHNDFEYVERRGILHVSRVLPDEIINQVKFEDSQGTMPRSINIHESPATIRLVAERLGNIDSLHYVEVGKGEALPIGPGRVEVELFSSALNFKDVAVSMGIVPENEHLLGLEGAGVIVRVGGGVTNRHVGQRVVVFEKGTFANRIIATTERTFPLPDNMTFEDAATLPAVYLTSIYSLFYLANLKPNQRVLIHSASGGIGIASIQLCQYMGCEIFVTVGTEEKRKFLENTFDIPSDHIFSSRTAEFARQILTATNGRGVHVILNSLTGDLLNESWRIVADGGTMIEIGKKDILDRNDLPMEPFGRNASFRALDFSYREISDELIAEIFSKLFDLIQQGHLKPIHPQQRFPYEDIPAAFRVLRGGKHMGKLVVTNGLNAEVKVQVRPAKRVLSSYLKRNDCYLIVGGLKGLCGSLAVYLAKNGAKHLAVMSRSGYNDIRAERTIRDIRALGCSLDLLQGDVSIIDDVRRCFNETSKLIGGIIQGAMVLQDRTFASMTHKDFHSALACKVQGSWNLHQVALEQSLPLSFFTMLSSVSGLVGQKGQANYAAGNVYQDSLAAYRRETLGLPACSVDLGVIEDIGYIHDHDGMQQKLDTSVWTGINEGLLRRILEYSIYQQSDDPAQQLNPSSAGQLVTGIPFPQPAESALLRDARFRGLYVVSDGVQGMAGNNGSQGTKDKDLQTLFLLLKSKGTEPNSVLTAALTVVNAQFTKTLRLAELMDPSRPLSIYGLDSLAAVEFRNWVRMTLGVELTTLEIVNAASLTFLCEKIITKLSNE